MKKIYTSFKSKVLLALLSSFTLSNAVYSQCGPIVQDFNNTGGSTAGFTGNLTYGQDGANGYLIKTNVIAAGTYTITTPTYTLPVNANTIGYGFQLDGSERAARVSVFVSYVSTLNGELTTVSVADIIPIYDNANQPATICRSFAISDFPGFPAGGNYRFRLEVSANTGNGNANKTLTFDNFRTNGTLSQIPLPVNFIGFEAKKANSSVELTWKVAGEENVLRYEVEKSEDGRTFTRIGSVLSSGNDTYTFTDANGSGTAYYRIKNVDGNGKFKFSTIAKIANGKSEIVLRGFPQPVQSQFILQHPVINGHALINLSTADGRVIKSVVPTNGSMQTPVDMSSLQAGLYLLRFSAGNGETQTLKVIKQ